MFFNKGGFMKPQVLVRMYGGKEFFVVDEGTTTEELINALLKMKNGKRILDGFIHRNNIPRKEVDYALQSQ